MSTVEIVITIVIVALIIIGRIGSKITHSKNLKDPNYQKKLQERQAEYRRKMEEERELDDYINSSSQEYGESDDYE